MSSDEQVTLVRPAAPTPSARGFSSALPPDLLEQVRGRIALLVLLMMIAFAIDPLLFFGGWLVARLKKDRFSASSLSTPLFTSPISPSSPAPPRFGGSRALVGCLPRGFSRWGCCTRLRFAS